MIRDSLLVDGGEMIKSHRELEVWQLGMKLAGEIYLLTEKLPAKEIYGLASQIRRASVSIPSNVAEGQQRHYRKEFVQFLYQALGSLAELETQLILVNEIYKIKLKDEEVTDKLGKKLRALINALEPRVTGRE